MKITFYFICFSISLLNLKAQVPTLGLIHYYPFNNNTNDYIGVLHGVPVGIALYGVDRFGNANACYDVIDESNHINLPSNVIIHDDYSISAWVKVKQITQWSRLYDFGNGYSIDNIVGKISNDWNSCPTMEYYINPTTGSWFLTNDSLSINDWHHIVYIQSGTTMEIFVNNNSIGTYLGTIPPQNIMRNSNKIGGSNAPMNDPTNAYIDDFRIYKRALNKEEVSMLYFENNNISTGINETSNNIQPIFFPNPTTGPVYSYIEENIESGQIILHNSFGQIIFSQQLLKGLNLLDLTMFPRGIYNVRVIVNHKEHKNEFIQLR